MHYYKTYALTTCYKFKSNQFNSKFALCRLLLPNIIVDDDAVFDWKEEHHIWYGVPT